MNPRSPFCAEAKQVDRPLDRRSFLRGASAALLITAMHPESAFGETGVRASQPSAKQPLIVGLRLLTATSLEEMKAFYHGLLRFPVLEHTEHLLTVRGGETPITFIAAPPEAGEPWYHVAFNIPENKILSAREWQLERSPLIPTPADKIDPGYPEEVRHFRHWNAHSLFFWDPAGNLLEYIARHDLGNSASGPFTAEDILYASEIAFVVDDQQASARDLHRDLGLGVYPQGTRHWWAMGDELGLLLCIPKRLWGENTDRPKRFAIYPTETSIGGAAAAEYALPGYPYKVTVDRQT